MGVREHRLYLNQAMSRLSLTRDIVDDMVRLGPLQSLMDDPEVNDIMVNGPDQNCAERRGRVEPSPLRFRDAAHLTNLAQRIASAVGRRIDESSPMVDARLPDGSRVNVIAPPLALRRHPHFHPQVRARGRLGLDELAARRAVAGHSGLSQDRDGRHGWTS